MSVSKIWVILYKLLLFVLLIILDPFAQCLLQGFELSELVSYFKDKCPEDEVGQCE